MRKFGLAIFGCATVLFACCAGVIGGIVGSRVSNSTLNNLTGGSISELRVTNQQEAVVDVASKSSNSVVSIVVSQRLSELENSPTNPFLRYFGLEEEQGTTRQIPDQLREIGAGTGFIVSRDGMIVTNRHVVDEDNAQYTVVLNNNERFEAKVLAKDTLLDIAFLKIETNNLTPLSFGDSSQIKVGQSVVAIGNALGEFSNTVSSGIVSGLGRNITATDQSGLSAEQLFDVIQTDASINSGNSGGPLLDLNGNVIGVNVAVANDANGIGFAIPSNVVVDLLERLNAEGEIVRPKLGVRFRMIDAQLKAANNLTVDQGAYVVQGTAEEPSIVPNSAAARAGIRAGDIVLAVNDVILTESRPLNVVIQELRVGDSVNLRILRGEQEITLTAVLQK
jgi:serine protease Do